MYKGYPCLVLELLHMDIYHMIERSKDRIELSKIRTIAKQVCYCGWNWEKKSLFHCFCCDGYLKFSSCL